LCIKQFHYDSFAGYNKMVNWIIQEFDKLPLRNIQKPRIAVVGEILVKFNPDANNDIVGIIEKEDVKIIVPNF
jgi:predicted nucleotide-binding protein (sugar kinase/HSP70/actin superfamily)